MENRIVKFKSKESAGLNLHAIPGHFATSHSHINYYVDVTSIKTRVSGSCKGSLHQGTSSFIYRYNRMYGWNRNDWCILKPGD